MDDQIHICHTPAGTIEYRLYGRGQPLLFLHGGHGNCHDDLFHKGFDPARFTLITPSRPGYGRTPVTEPAGPAQTADLTAALLEALSIPRVVVIGISAGGPSAVALAARHPARVDRLILISAITQRWLTPADPLYKKGKRLFGPGVERYTWAMFRGLFRLFPHAMTRMLAGQVSTHPPRQFSHEEIADIRRMISTQRSHAGFVLDLDQTLPADTLHQVSCPTLILHSRNDHTVSGAHADFAHRHIRSSQLKWYANAWGHLLWTGSDSALPIADALAFLPVTT